MIFPPGQVSVSGSCIVIKIGREKERTGGSGVTHFNDNPKSGYKGGNGDVTSL